MRIADHFQVNQIQLSLFANNDFECAQQNAAFKHYFHKMEILQVGTS